MSKNVWDLPLDLQFRYSADIPRFRRKDSAVLNIRLFNAKERVDISNFSKATLSIQLPSQEIKYKEAISQGTDMDTYVQYQFSEDVMTEIGLYTLILSVEKDGGRVSTQKFSVYFYDNESSADFEFIDMMQNLQLQINYLDSIMDNIVLTELIGKSNGLIPLDANGKIPIEYMPIFLQEHINTNVYLSLVHGLMVDSNLNLIYKGKGGNLEYVGHKEGSATLTLFTTISLSKVTLSYQGVGTVVEQRWLIGDNSLDKMKLDGKLFTGNSFMVENIGMHTIYYKDANGREYLHKFKVELWGLKAPEYEASVIAGFLKVEGTPEYAFVKVADGIRDLTYMRKTSNGTLVVFPHAVTKTGYLTVYIVDIYGREVIKVLNVQDSDLKPVGDNRPLEIRLYTNGWYSDKSVPVGAVTVSYVVFDADGKRAGDKVGYVIRPNSTTYNQDSDSGITITRNGTYTWTVYNKAGIASTASLKIENIGVEKNLKDLPIGSKFYIYQTEAVLLKREGNNHLIALKYGWNLPFTNQYVTATKKNLYPNSPVMNQVYLTNFDDNERQLDNNVKGKVNYQYGTVTPNTENSVIPVGSPVYEQQQRFVLDAFTLQDAINAGYLTVSREEMTCTPIDGTDDRIVYIDQNYKNYSSGAVTKQYSISWVGLWQNEKTKVWQKGWS